MRKKGFTLIELLIVMTIIAVLAGLALVSYQNARKTARDGKRKSDLETIRSALEMCYSDDNQYPDSISGSVTCVGNSTYLDPTPTDPIPTGNYYYDRTSTTTYVLCAYLEGGAPDNCIVSESCGLGSCNYGLTQP